MPWSNGEGFRGIFLFLSLPGSFGIRRRRGGAKEKVMRKGFRPVPAILAHRSTLDAPLPRS
jgi:hypothetical protein